MTRTIYPDGAVRILMLAGEWLIPVEQRPKLAPPPREFTSTERMVDKTINPLNGMGMGELRF